MSSIFYPSKRDAAIKRIIEGVVLAANNSVIAIKSICAVCYNPERHPDMNVLINNWHNYMFTRNFSEITDDKYVPIPKKTSIILADGFLNHIVSFFPTLYYHKKVIYESKIFKWTDDDFKELKKNIIYEWYYKDWDNLSLDEKIRIDLSIETRVKQTVRVMSFLPYYNLLGFKLSRKNGDITPLQKLKSIIYHQVKPRYEYSYQSDLFDMYTDRYIPIIESSLCWLDNELYEVGRYLQDYFKWSLKNKINE